MKLKVQAIENLHSRQLEAFSNERRCQDARIEQLHIENTQLSQRLGDLENLLHNLISANPKLKLDLPGSQPGSARGSRKASPYKRKGPPAVVEMTNYETGAFENLRQSQMLSVIREGMRAGLSSSNVMETTSEDHISETPREHTRAANYKT